MRRTVIIGAPSNIGIRPYDDGRLRGLDLAPRVLRERALAERLGASDLGDVEPPTYRDRERPAGRARNEAEVESYSRALADRTAPAVVRGAFTLLLGGDCSILLGALLGARQALARPIGLVYVDAHADFATPQESSTGSIASMDLAMAVGRGDTPLARLTAGEGPLVRAHDVALIGRRDQAEAWYGHEALATSDVLDLPMDRITEAGVGRTADAVLGRVGRSELGGFWIHLDADVLDPEVMPAVDSPEPGGFGFDDLAALITPWARHPRALGMELTIYDPLLDPTGDAADRLVDFLEAVIGGS